jgi:hypothetical protein
MEINIFSELDRVVLDFTKRTIEMYGYDGEFKSESCPFTEEGRIQFQNIVEYCQKVLPADQRIYKL